MVSGLYASILAMLLLMGALYYLQSELAGFIDLINTDALLMVFAAVLVLGILLSVVATFFAVNKYLRMGVDKLYYI